MPFSQLLKQEMVILDTIVNPSSRKHEPTLHSWEALFERYPLPSPQYQLLALSGGQEAAHKIRERLQERTFTYREQKHRPEGAFEKLTALVYSPYRLQPPAFDPKGPAVFFAPNDDGVTMSLWMPHRIVLFPSDEATRTYLDFNDPDVVRVAVYQSQEHSCTTYDFSILLTTGQDDR
jgi:hypothetical protein